MSTALEKLFDRHFPDGPNELKCFRQRLEEVQLAFDVEANIREQILPPQPGFPNGLPSFIYYYIKGTQFGTGKRLPVGHGDPRHIFTSDGIGLNMGCPIRLARALAVLFSLKPDDRREPLAQISAVKNHFSCVEELLWLTVWRKQTEVTRGGELVQKTNGNKPPDVDWFFFCDGIPIYLESKFRPTDWVRTPDCGARGVEDRFFGKIGRKFPPEKSAFRKCLAAITGFAEPISGSPAADSRFWALCEKKLTSTPGLDAVLYRSMLGPIYICSLYPEVVSQIGPLIRVPELIEYPPCYPIVFNRQLRDQRTANEIPTPLPERGRVIFAILPDNKPSPVFRPQYPYRFQIPERNKDGEPVFKYVPPFLTSDDANKQ
jgi:hypothetical protein